MNVQISGKFKRTVFHRHRRLLLLLKIVYKSGFLSLQSERVRVRQSERATEKKIT